MKKLLILAIVGSCFAQTPQVTTTKGRQATYCGQLKNSYGIGYDGGAGTYAPWIFLVDTIKVDTTSNGTYKKIGTSGDTTKTIPTGGPVGYWNIVGRLTGEADSLGITVKPYCYSNLLGTWIKPKGQSTNAVITNDTLYTSNASEGNFGYESYVPSFCDSVKFLISKAVTLSKSDTTKVFRLGACLQ